MDQILYTYYADNARKLRRVVDRILLKFGGLSNKDMDDFYSLANEVFVDAMGRYDGAQSFDGFLYSCLSNKIKSEITRRNRGKRKADRMALSLDAPVGDDDGYMLKDLVAGSYDIESDIFGGVMQWPISWNGILQGCPGGRKRCWNCFRIVTKQQKYRGCCTSHKGSMRICWTAYVLMKT